MTYSVQKLSLLIGSIIISAITTLNAVVTESSSFQAQAEAYATGEVLIQFRDGYSASSVESKSQLNSILGANQYTQQIFHNLDTAVIHSDAYTTEELLEKMQNWNLVATVAPNYVNRLMVDVNDTYYSDLWALHNTGQAGGTPDADIDAPEAWSIERGSKEVVIAVLDTGIDYTHHDLRENMWDGTAFGLPYHGYDFAADRLGRNDNDPMPYLSHGTHVAGTIGAVANTIGVIGIAPNVSLMALKVFRSDGNAFDSDILEALNFISQKVDEGVNIVAINASYGSSGRSEVIRNAIAELGTKGVLVCAAAGNESINNDLTPTYPANYDLDNIISVTATNREDRLADFSNYGPHSVDIAAPGVDITSTIPKNSYDTYSGTSMATPYVTGAVALLAAHRVQSTVAERKVALLESSDSLASLQGRIKSAGRLNVYNALQYRAPEHNTTDITTWSTGAYTNNEDRNQTLSIHNARYLRVTVNGQTEEHYDFIYIYDAQGNQVLQLDGNISRSIVLPGNAITARLVSDNTQGSSGATVTITAVTHDSTNSNVTTWTTGRYGINEDRSRKLMMEKALRLHVTVTGETEAGYDFIYIYDKAGNEVAKLDGIINTTFTVEGDTITARLLSDYSVVASGVTVTIEAVYDHSNDITIWTTGAYGNNEDRTQTLSIAGATQLKVSVTGATERYYDFFYIYDEQNNPVAQLNGVIDRTFTIKGSSITARLVSDHFDGAKGVTVRIGAL